MKLSVAILVAAVCMVGMVLADYSYMPVYPGQSTGGFGGDNTFLMLIGFLFLIMFLFGSTGGQDTVTFVNVTTK